MAKPDTHKEDRTVTLLERLGLVINSRAEAYEAERAKVARLEKQNVGLTEDLRKARASADNNQTLADEAVAQAKGFEVRALEAEARVAEQAVVIEGWEAFARSIVEVNE